MNKNKENAFCDFMMSTKEIANILYNMSLDMDYADYIEHAAEEIECMTEEIETIKASSPCLIQALEIIASNNADMLDHFQNLHLTV